MIGIALQELLNLEEVVLFCKFDCLVPLIEEHAAVNGFLDVTHFNIALNREFRNSERDEFVCELFEDWGVFWKNLDELFKIGGVF